MKKAQPLNITEAYDKAMSKDPMMKSIIENSNIHPTAAEIQINHEIRLAQIEKILARVCLALAGSQDEYVAYTIALREATSLLAGVRLLSPDELQTRSSDPSHVDDESCSHEHGPTQALDTEARFRGVPIEGFDVRAQTPP